VLPKLKAPDRRAEIGLNFNITTVMLKVIHNKGKIIKKHGGFGIEILFPGNGVGLNDSGVSTIGRIDQATVSPGTLVPMHPHQNDEILTYIRSGHVEHKDSEGHVEIITNKRLMMMNAGAEFQHEELVLPSGGTLTALQVFIRPESGGLVPKVQFHDFENEISINEWRPIAGKDNDFPLQIRSSTWIYDMRLEKEKIQSLPKVPVNDAIYLIYLFDGEIMVNDSISLQKGESLLVENESIELLALQNSDIVFFVTDPNAIVFKEGMYSGNLNTRK
jgi:redox-sensitive bicupin YhaK (pirin superfamily)